MGRLILLHLLYSVGTGSREEDYTRHTDGSWGSYCQLSGHLVSCYEEHLSLDKWTFSESLKIRLWVEEAALSLGKMGQVTGDIQETEEQGQSSWDAGATGGSAEAPLLTQIGRWSHR